MRPNQTKHKGRVGLQLSDAAHAIHLLSFNGEDPGSSPCGDIEIRDPDKDGTSMTSIYTTEIVKTKTGFEIDYYMSYNQSIYLGRIAEIKHGEGRHPNVICVKADDVQRLIFPSQNSAEDFIEWQGLGR